MRDGGSQRQSRIHRKPGGLAESDPVRAARITADASCIAADPQVEAAVIAAHGARDAARITADGTRHAARTTERGTIVAAIILGIFTLSAAFVTRDDEPVPPRASLGDVREFGGRIGATVRE